MTSVRAKFLWINVPLVVLASLIVFGVFEYHSYRSEMAKIEAKKERLLESQAEVIAPALWQGSRVRVQHILTILATDPDVVGVEVRDRQGELFGAVGDATSPDAPNLAGSQAITYFTNADYATLGRLYLAVSDRRAWTELYTHSVLAGILTSVLVLAAVVSAMIANWHTIGIPLRRLYQAIETGRGEEGHVRPRVSWKSNDEIGAVVRAFNDLQTIQERNETRLRQAWEEAREARWRAEAATQAKSEFLANMSHEIRTPMNAVLGLSHMLRRQDLTPRQRDQVEKIHAAGSSLLGIINDILDFSKVEAGKLVLDEADFDPEDLLSHIAAVSGLRAEEKGLELIFRIAPDTPQLLHGDSGRIGQMLLNLVNNAVKFTQSGEVVVSIEPAHQTDGMAGVRFTVADTGPGLTPDQKDRLFKPFSQADGSTTRRFGGTGLGLAICRQFSEAMGGEIGVESTPGVGSTFHITLPLKSAQDSGGDSTQSSLAKMRRLDGVRVLVVDDNAVLRDHLCGWLADRGAQVAQAGDADHALAAAAALAPVDLILLDWPVPGLTEADAVAMLRRTARPDSPSPIIATPTVMGRETLAAESQALGIARTVAKPLIETPLAEAIARTLGQMEADAVEADVVSDLETPELSGQLTGVRLLLAEDNPINQEVACDVLREAGAEVLVADNGQDAVRIALDPQRGVDLVLMDIQMPVMDGLQATQEIRRQRGPEDLPVLAMTAHAMTHERERCLEAGMNDHVAKPFDPQFVVRRIAEWVSKTRRWADSEGALKGADVLRFNARPDTSAFPRLTGIDAEALANNVNGDVNLAMSLLGLFREQFAKTGEALLPQVEARDFAALQREAHDLKSGAGNIGARRVWRAADALDRACWEERTGDIEGAAVELRAALDELLEALADLLDTLEDDTARSRAG